MFRRYLRKSLDSVRHLDKTYHAIGLNKSELNEISEHGDIEFFLRLPEDNFKDLSFKLIFNSAEYKRENLDFSTYLALTSEDIVYDLLELLSIYNLTNTLESRTVKHKYVYDKINSRKLIRFVKFSKLAYLRTKVEHDYLYINRLKRDTVDNLYVGIKKRYESVVGETSNPWISGNIVGRLTEIVKTRINNFVSLFENVKQEMDIQISFLNTIIDYKRQRRMFLLTIVSLIVSLIALAVSILAL
ncbi:hypothetical protein JOC77_002786 [Peribacillus deserti]|uniref:Uncharacterized protein n=1 Tax=Peribacillus deserti TaxID=673318 RepID=A0ABS2QJJ7_9BACI|nr:hypothetical protein [Peribacillus deserti]MBM7693346.1 hypothetical protein [Peribacillus deserti]